jgi:NAD(P)H-dependent FMN reductase
MTDSTTTRLLLISGSLRGESTNTAVVNTLAAAPPDGVEPIVYGGMGTLPHFNPDDDVEGDPPPSVADLRDQVEAVDAILFCTPEYAGALPGSFKNLLEWTVGGHEIYRKPVAWINVSGPAAPTGGADAHDSLANVLGYINADLVEEACARVPLTRQSVGDDGLVQDEGAIAELRRAAARLGEYARERAASDSGPAF